MKTPSGVEQLLVTIEVVQRSETMTPPGVGLSFIYPGSIGG
jgi:hypothetical protein